MDQNIQMGQTFSKLRRELFHLCNLPEIQRQDLEASAPFLKIKLLSVTPSGILRGAAADKELSPRS